MGCTPGFRQTGTRFELGQCVSTAERTDDEKHEMFYLGRLAAELRVAIGESLLRGLPQFAVALDTARDFVETVLLETHPKSTRVGVARARAELALEAWREARDVRH